MQQKFARNEVFTKLFTNQLRYETYTTKINEERKNKSY